MIDNMKQYNDIYKFNGYGNLDNKDLLSGIYPSKKDYFYKLALRIVQIILKHYKKGAVLDVCSGIGTYMFLLAPCVEHITGIDFVKKAVDDVNKYLSDNNINNAECIEADAKKLPFENESFDISYCFSSLYTIEGFEKAISEMARVTSNDGTVILDLGTKKSINTIISNYATKSAGLPDTFYYSDGEILGVLKKYNLIPIENIYFQIFPYWGTHPSFLNKFCSQKFNHFMAKEIKGKMLDEIVSNLPIIKNFAFRRIMVCKKVR